LLFNIKDYNKLHQKVNYPYYVVETVTKNIPPEREQMSKDKTTDMSINPADIKKSTTETNAQGKKVKVKKERKDPIKYPSHHKGHGKVSNKVHMKRGTEVKRVTRIESESLK
jgi:hypothetical protein